VDFSTVFGIFGILDRDDIKGITNSALFDVQGTFHKVIESSLHEVGVLYVDFEKGKSQFYYFRV